MIIKPKTEDNGSDGVFLVDGQLTVRMAGGCAEWSVPMPEEYVHTGDVYEYAPHEIDEHVDKLAIIATIKGQCSNISEIWRKEINDLLDQTDDPEPEL